MIGATGRVGRLVVEELVASGLPVRALTRNPVRANFPAAVDVVTGDLTVPDSLDTALKGVSAVFLLWTASPATAPAVIALIAAHAPRVVLLSSPHQTPHPFFEQPNPLATMLAELERVIAEAGIASTIIRPGMFASNVAGWWGAAIRSGNAVRWPYAAVETAPIDERDIATVAAWVLVDSEYAGADYVLTGPERLTHADQLQIIGEVIGRDIPSVELSPDEFRSATAGIWPPAAVEMLLAAWGATIGVPAYLTNHVAEITGRPARTFRQWVQDHVDRFQGES